ncbi:MAG: PAS domain-containing protein [Erysipelotrichaceae bacterium]|nr:PAS domain-containing protein [Erysipelotrichaceae bacterium]
MANKIFRSILMVAIFVLAATAVFVIDEMYRSFVTSQLEVLQAETRIIAYGIERDGIGFIDSLDNTDYRLTLIDKDGTVLFDNSGNDVSTMDNHLDRIEVAQALKEGFGSSSRQSATLMERLVYTAVRLKDGRIIRLSETYPSIFQAITIVSQPLLLVILIMIIVSFVIAYRLADRIIEPLSKLDMDHPDENTSYKELKPIIRKLSAQQEMIDEDRKALKRSRQEFETITENISEGLILLNSDKIIIDINKAASKILGIDETMIGKPVLEVKGYEKFSDLVEDASMKHHGSRKIRFGDRNYEFEISPVETDQELLGFVLLFFDDSYKEASENMRREFAGNVSHELKTPLQSISGYAELLKNRMVSKDDKNEVYDRIYFEAQRMIKLINDVIKISHLDEENLNIPKERINLNTLCKEITDLQADEIRNNVSIEYRGTDAWIYGNRELIEAIYSNLLENAIRYNREGGYVYVDICSENDKVILKVEDTGVGIDEEDYERIFERFYRVDKGRSKKAGGTGLGLSIVKHACILNNAEVKVESIPEKGSIFTVLFDRV